MWGQGQSSRRRGARSPCWNIPIRHRHVNKTESPRSATLVASPIIILANTVPAYMYLESEFAIIQFSPRAVPASPTALCQISFLARKLPPSTTQLCSTFTPHHTHQPPSSIPTQHTNHQLTYTNKGGQTASPAVLSCRRLMNDKSPR